MFSAYRHFKNKSILIIKKNIYFIHARKCGTRLCAAHDANTLVLWIALLSGLLSFNVAAAIKSEFETENSNLSQWLLVVSDVPFLPPLAKILLTTSFAYELGTLKAKQLKLTR